MNAGSNGDGDPTGVAARMNVSLHIRPPWCAEGESLNPVTIPAASGFYVIHEDQDYPDEFKPLRRHAAAL